MSFEALFESVEKEIQSYKSKIKDWERAQRGWFAARDALLDANQELNKKLDRTTFAYNFQQTNYASVAQQLDEARTEIERLTRLGQASAEAACHRIKDLEDKLEESQTKTTNLQTQLDIVEDLVNRLKTDASYYKDRWTDAVIELNRVKTELAMIQDQLNKVLIYGTPNRRIGPVERRLRKGVKMNGGTRKTTCGRRKDDWWMWWSTK